MIIWCPTGRYTAGTIGTITWCNVPAAAANVPAAAVSLGAAGAGGVGRRGVSVARESLSKKISARIGVFILVRRRLD